MKSLNNKVAIITGASSPRGIGYAAAIRMAKAGAHIVVTDLVDDQNPKQRLDKIADEIRDHGVNTLAIEMDVTDETQVNAAIGQVVDRFQRIDIVFNNAGVHCLDLFENTELEKFDLMYSVNARGVAAVMKAVIPQMKENGGGSIINHSSVGGIYADAHFSVYDASKFAVVALTKCVALEVGEYNIRVNVICPGPIDTEMADHMPPYFAKLEGITAEDARRKIGDATALKRWGKAEEVANVVAFLASDESSYITGATIPITGGFPQAL